jgi:hypothetical protein|tara:strand:- start:387 stop:689 length:303 start_codon:yes stop_codon:yes gene_type:complete
MSKQNGKKVSAPSKVWPDDYDTSELAREILGDVKGLCDAAMVLRMEAMESEILQLNGRLDEMVEGTGSFMATVKKCFETADQVAIRRQDVLNFCYGTDNK